MARQDPQEKETTASTMSHAVDEASKAARSSAKSVQWTLHSWADIPSWQQDNHYITSGYRAPSNSYLHSLRSSIFHLHNESVNVYTHLLGAVAACAGAAYVYRHWFWLEAARARYATAAPQDIAVLACYFAGAAGCLGMSATYHALSNHSARVAAFGNRLDYLGIVLLIWGSFIPTMYYGFKPEDARLVKTYWVMITTLAIITGTTALHPAFRTPALRPFRASMFAGMGLSGIVPIIHGLLIYGREALSPAVGLGWVLLEGAMYIVGAGIYAARFPERLRPGTFDIWSSSHQIFHVFVLLGAGSHFVGLMQAFDHRHAKALS